MIIPILQSGKPRPREVKGSGADFRSRKRQSQKANRGRLRGLGYFIVHPGSSQHVYRKRRNTAKSLSNSAPWCSGGPLGAGRWGRAGSVGGTGACSPHPSIRSSPVCRAAKCSFCLGRSYDGETKQEFLECLLCIRPGVGMGGEEGEDPFGRRVRSLQNSPLVGT